MWPNVVKRVGEEIVCTISKPTSVSEFRQGSDDFRCTRSDPAGVILYVMDGPYRLPFPYRTGCSDKSCPAVS